MTRKEIDAILDLSERVDDDTPADFRRGWAAAISVARGWFAEKFDRRSPGPDDWRTPLGAPAIAGCPVEELPAHGVEFRGWLSIGGGEEFEDRCELVAFESSWQWKSTGSDSPWRRSSHLTSAASQSSWRLQTPSISIIRQVAVPSIILAWRPAAVGPPRLRSYCCQECFGS